MTAVRPFVVTGASSGIGREISKTLLDAGHTVIGIARDPDRAAIEDPHFESWSIDLSELDALPAQLNAIAGKYPDLKGVIACAGQGRFGSLEEFAYHQIRQLIDLNLTSQLFVARAFLPAMKRRGGGDLIFIGSEAGLAGGGGEPFTPPPSLPCAAWHSRCGRNVPEVTCAFASSIRVWSERSFMRI